MHRTTTAALALAFAAFTTPAAACGFDGQTYAEQRACEQRQRDHAKAEAMEATKEYGRVMEQWHKEQRARERAFIAANPDRYKAPFVRAMRQSGVSEADTQAAWASGVEYGLSLYDE
jgi:hypothetical protein